MFAACLLQEKKHTLPGWWECVVCTWLSCVWLNSWNHQVWQWTCVLMNSWNHQVWQWTCVWVNFWYHQVWQWTCVWMNSWNHRVWQWTCVWILEIIKVWQWTCACIPETIKYGTEESFDTHDGIHICLGGCTLVMTCSCAILELKKIQLQNFFFHALLIHQSLSSCSYTLMAWIQTVKYGNWCVWIPETIEYGTDEKLWHSWNHHHLGGFTFCSCSRQWMASVLSQS